ncbi:MAG: hypothetical protein ABFS32_16410 [Bacteroidota bacterium]
MKFRNLLQILVAVSILYGCDTNVKTSSKEVSQPDVALPSADVLPVDSDYLTKLKSIQMDGTEREAEFATEVLSTISQFTGLPADTTVLIIANIDGVEPLDTIVNRIWVKNDTVYQHTNWSRNGAELWVHDLTNPYLWISDREEFDYGTRDVWITFTVALKHALPTVHEKEKYAHLYDFAYDMGKATLERKGMDSAGLKQYIDDFTGQLVEYGEPELREGLIIWHEPSQMFVTFYHP